MIAGFYPGSGPIQTPAGACRVYQPGSESDLTPMPALAGRGTAA